MVRQSFAKILDWSNSDERLPLVIRGARQVGKSYLVKWLAKQRFKTFLELNFEKKPEFKMIFAINDVHKIITQLEVLFNCRITPGETLIFLDEIQSCPEVLASLRWFAEDIPELHIIAAGSLLDFALHDFQSSMPVGRITFMYLEPFSFIEFTQAIGEKKLSSFLKGYSINQELPELIHKKALELFKQYLLIGGMPKAIRVFRDKKSYLEVERIHRDLIESFKSDFNKYRKRIPSERLVKVFDSITLQLGKKFVYSRVDPEEKNAPIKEALGQLLMARLCFKAQAAYCNGIPLGAEIDEKLFKIFSLDIGLANTNIGFNLSDFKNVNDVFLVHNGAMAEQFVAQMLRIHESQIRDPRIFYWSREKTGADAEVDFVIQKGSKIIPVEVKSGKSGSLKSLHVMMEEKKLKNAIRFDLNLPTKNNISLQNWEYQLNSLPLYLSERLYELIGLNKWC